VPKEQFNNITF